MRRSMYRMEEETAIHAADLPGRRGVPTLSATTFDAVRELYRSFRPALVPQVRALALNVGIYDRLLPSQHRLDDTSDARQVAQAVRSAHDQARISTALTTEVTGSPRRPVHPAQ